MQNQEENTKKEISYLSKAKKILENIQNHLCEVRTSFDNFLELVKEYHNIPNEQLEDCFEVRYLLSLIKDNDEKISNNNQQIISFSDIINKYCINENEINENEINENENEDDYINDNGCINENEHEFVTDYIDISPDASQRIEYCIICGYTK